MNPYLEKEQTAPENELPTLFASRLNLLNNLFAELSTAVHSGDAGQQQAGLDNFSEALAAMKADGLDEEEKLSWRELSMLLASDVVLLKETESAGETEQLYATMAEHFHQLRSRFGLVDTTAARLGSDQLRGKITQLLSSYLDLQQQLAADNFEDARAETATIQPLAENVIAELESSGFDQAASLAGRLTADIHLLIEGATLEEIRAAFYPFSQTLTSVVDTFGSNLDTPLYLQYCPMAFDNKGATWLATSEEISNPYYGAMMLRCGEVRQQIAQ